MQELKPHCSLDRNVVNTQNVRRNGGNHDDFADIIVDDNDAFGGGAADTVVVIASGSVHGDGDGSDDIDRKVNRKINADPY